MPKDDYKHLNNDFRFEMSLSIPEVADKIVGMNYGVHRMLSAMIDALRERWGGESMLADELEKVLCLTGEIQLPEKWRFDAKKFVDGHLKAMKNTISN